MASAKQTRIGNVADHVDQQVSVCGWVNTIRDMGKIAFLEIRDISGPLQVVVDNPKDISHLGNEYVVQVTGTVRKRGERYINSKIATGHVELAMESVEVINPSAELPFELKDTSSVNEELRLKYRYLDLRSPRMLANMKLRQAVNRFTRDFFDEREFIEIETPMLTKGTPEGAREYLVPSRLHPGQFYVLPQSPQQYKQLLMIAGLDRYYQIARCLRDEDQRGDRQPEFTQLDLEMSFVEQEDILQVTEEWLIGLVHAVTPDKKITRTPFPRFTYTESMEKFGTDRPDLRKDKNDPNELAFAWVTDFPMFEKHKETGEPTAVHHPFTGPKEKDPTKLKKMDPFSILSDCYDIVLNGYEVGSGSIRITNVELQRAVFEILGLDKKTVEQRFGHLLDAYKYGAPTHGGIAPGLDRIVMILAGEPNIREVIAFPKTGDGRDPLTGAPTEASAQALKDAHVQVVKPKK